MASLSLFGHNTRGFSFEVETSCRKASTPVRCTIGFNGSNTPISFGLLKRKEVEPDPDIAGIGIFCVLSFQAFLAFLLAAWGFGIRELRKQSNGKKKGYDTLGHEVKGKPKECNVYRFLFLLSDTLLFLSVAYILNFIFTGKCVMSTYHYYIALDSTLIACSTLLLTFITSGRYYWKTCIAIPRLVSTIFIFVSMGILLGYQMIKHHDTDFPSWKVPQGNGSIILLPASCFFDPDLIARDSPYAPHSKHKLTPAQLHQLGRPPVKGILLPEIWLFVILAALFLFGSIVFLASYCCSSQLQKDHQPQRRNICTKILSGVTFLACLATDIYCTVHISQLRAWAGSSGWLKDDSEARWYTLSQLMTYSALVGGLIFLVCDQRKLREKN